MSNIHWTGTCWFKMWSKLCMHAVCALVVLMYVLIILIMSTQGSATPLTDLSAASERSTLNRGAACYFNSSRGADDDDEGFQMELNDIYYRLVLLNQMSKSFNVRQYMQLYHKYFHMQKKKSFTVSLKVMVMRLWAPSNMKPYKI